ncbi:MAG: hypothetical protein GX220_01895 [Treponema sp.]|nr:hypothetical protein [Treponema sp.]
MNQQDVSITGRKIFFLYPHAIIQNEAIELLSNMEYEIYGINDSEKIIQILEKCPSSLLFINVDSFMSVTDWLIFVNKIRDNPNTSSTLIGILTNTGSNSQISFLNSNFKPQAGIISVRSDAKATIDSIIEVLDSFNCHGRRKYLRTYCENDAMATLNFTWNDQIINMKIRDISSVGLCGIYKSTQTLRIPKNTIISNTLLTLRGIKVLCEMVTFAVKKEPNSTIFVFLFFQLSNEDKDKIRTYIRRNLQSQLDALIS